MLGLACGPNPASLIGSACFGMVALWILGHIRVLAKLPAMGKSSGLGVALGGTTMTTQRIDSQLLLEPLGEAVLCSFRED